MKERISKLPKRPETYEEWYEQVGYRYPCPSLQARNTNRKSVLARDSYSCQKCGLFSQAKLEINHILPIVYGGDNDPANLITLCSLCHRQAPDPSDFYDYISTGLPPIYDNALAVSKMVMLSYEVISERTPSKEDQVLRLFHQAEQIVKDYWELCEKPIIYEHLAHGNKRLKLDAAKDSIYQFNEKYGLTKELELFKLYEILNYSMVKRYAKSDNDRNWQNVAQIKT